LRLRHVLPFADARLAGALTQANAWLYDKTVVDGLFAEAAQRYENRNNDFTVMTAALARRGDNAEMVTLALV
jgi:large subunit ribosomal protein L17